MLHNPEGNETSLERRQTSGLGLQLELHVLRIPSSRQEHSTQNKHTLESHLTEDNEFHSPLFWM